MRKPNWLDVIVTSTKHGESPERFYYWSAMATIAAVMGKRVYLDRHFYKLFPNIYVLIVSARSGLRKGVPVALANKLLKMSGVRVLDGQSSIQGAIKELSLQVSNQNGTHNLAQGIITSGELAASMVEDNNTWTYLTDLYNTHEHEPSWKKTLAGQAMIELKEPCISFLAASNEKLFESAIKSKDMEGGFIARTFIIHESKRRGINSLVDKPEGIVPAEVLGEHLKKLKEVSGVFSFNKEGGQFYDYWYRTLCAMEIDDQTGTFERFGDSVLKVAMLLALARIEEYKELILTKDILELAIEKCEPCLLGTRRVAMGQGNSQLAPAVAKVLKHLIDSPDGCARRKDILRKLWPDIESIELERVIETLKQAGAIDEPRVEGTGKDKDLVYRMDKERLEEYMKYRREIQ